CGRKNGPRSAEKISKGKTHGQTKKPCTGRIQGKKRAKKKPPEKSDGLPCSLLHNNAGAVGVQVGIGRIIPCSAIRVDVGISITRRRGVVLAPLTLCPCVCNRL